jgi:uncharacterized protein YqfB (UPF0267 family)
MSTSAQIDATPVAGKRASSSNAIRTGLTSIALYIRPEDQDEFDSFWKALRDELLPNGVLQASIFDTILHASWNIQRCTVLEAGLQVEAANAGIADPMLDDQMAKKLDRLYRYRRLHESTRRQAMADFRKLKTEELWRQESNASAEPISVLADAKAVMSQLHTNHARSATTHLKELKAIVESVNVPRPAAFEARRLRDAA